MGATKSHNVASKLLAAHPIYGCSVTSGVLHSMSELNVPASKIDKEDLANLSEFRHPFKKYF